MASCNSATSPHRACLPPHWYRWRRISPGLAWGSLRLPLPGLHGCSPGTERKKYGLAGAEKRTLTREGSSLRLGHPPRFQIYLAAFLKGLGQPGPSHHLGGGGTVESLILPSAFELLSADSFFLDQQPKRGFLEHRTTKVLLLGMRSIYNPLTSCSPLQVLTPK